MQIQAICIKKYRDKNNNITGYRLCDKHNNFKDFDVQVLKTLMARNQIVVHNLVLTFDNRLIDKTSKKKKSPLADDIDWGIPKRGSLDVKDINWGEKPSLSVDDIQW